MTHARRLRLTLLALSLGVPLSAAAQNDRSGRLEGRVIDSARARPLVGARVVTVSADERVNASGAALTDTSGRYRIDSLTPGRYWVEFESPVLDSLEITLAPRQVVIVAGQTATIDLGLPPATKLRDAVCPGVPLPPQTGVLYGHVVDTEIEGPLSNVVLAMSWQDRDVDRATGRPVNHERTASATTDARGWYRLCGVPTDTWLYLQLQHKGRTGAVSRAMVSDSLGIAVRHLSFTASTSNRGADSLAVRTDGAVEPSASGTALLSGIVRGLGDAPLAAADVGVRGTGASARTDALGRYALRGLPAGTQVLDVRHLGYEPAEMSVELRSGRTMTRDVPLQRIVNLDSIRVVAQRSHYREFTALERRKPFGVYIGPEEMESRRRVTYASDVIAQIPGFRIIGQGYNAQVIGGRGATRCTPNIVVDGVPNVSINDVSAAEIGAIAVDRDGEITPALYNRGCGAIMIWTKR